MKRTDNQIIGDQNGKDFSPEPIEKDYPRHKKDPGPSEEAVIEKDEDGAGKVLRWILPALVVLLMVFWFIVKK